MQATTKVGVCATAFVLASMSALCAAPAPTVEHVRDLRSSVAGVRAHAAVALGRLGNPSAVPALIQALTDQERTVRREAAKALAFLKDSRAAAPLAKALHDDDRNVRFYAAYALGEVRDPATAPALLDALRDEAWCVRDQAAWALRQIANPGLAGQLVAALRQGGADVATIVWILRGVGKDATGPLTAMLHDADARVRIRAARALGELRANEAVGPLVAALKDPSAGVRLVAVRSLSEIGDDRAEKPLKDLLAGEKDATVRTMAGAALLRMSSHGDLAAHWSFEQRAGNVAKDVTGRGNDGKIIGCTPVKGKVGRALSFGNGKYVELGKPPDLAVGNRPLTVMAWARSDARNGVVVARGGAFCGFSLYIKDGLAKFGIHREKDGPAYIAAGRRDVVGAWVHLAGVIRQDRIELFVNGKLAATAKTSGYLPGECGQGMEVGFDVGNSPAEITDAFQGIIDEVKVYHAALTERDMAKQAGLRVTE